MSAGGLEVEPQSIRRSWIEVALPAEHRGPDVLVVDEGDRRPRRVGGVGARSLVGSVDVGIEQLQADIARVEATLPSTTAKTPDRGPSDKDGGPSNVGNGSIAS